MSRTKTRQNTAPSNMNKIKQNKSKQNATKKIDTARQNTKSDKSRRRPQKTRRDNKRHAPKHQNQHIASKKHKNKKRHKAKYQNTHAGRCAARRARLNSRYFIHRRNENKSGKEAWRNKEKQKSLAIARLRIFYKCCSHLDCRNNHILKCSLKTE